MYQRPQTNQNPIPTQAAQNVPEGQSQGFEHTYATPMFEPYSGVQAQTQTPQASPQTEQGTQGILSPFQMQPGTFGQQAPHGGRTPTPGHQHDQIRSGSVSPTRVQQPQTNPAVVNPAATNLPIATPWTTGVLQGVPSAPPASQMPHSSQTVQSTPGSVQPPFFQAAQPPVQAVQSPGTLGSQPGQLGAKSPRQPPMDIYDAGDEFEIDIELPGVSKKDIRLAGHEQGLNLRAVAQQRETEDLVASERGERIFQRDIALGFAVDPEEVEARFENGVLTVTVPNKAAKGLGAIEIK